MQKKWHAQFTMCVSHEHVPKSQFTMCVCHFLCICLLKCEGKFYSLCLPKVSGTQWMTNACLFSEWMKTVKIMNEKHPESCIWWGTNNGSTTEWRCRFTRTADSHNGGREGLLWERVFPSTARIITSYPESLARKYMTSPQKLQRTGQLLSEGITQNPVYYASFPPVTPGSHLPDSLL